jgi:hypothetical protein
MLLLTRQDEQLGVGSEHFAHCVLKLTPGAYPRGNAFGPLLGDAFDAVFASGHKGQRPSDVAGILGIGAMASGSATAGVGLGERTREQVVGDREMAQELELALAEARGLGTFGFDIHL